MPWIRRTPNGWLLGPLLLVGGCGGGGTEPATTPPPPPPGGVASVTVAPPIVTMQVGATAQLTATPKDAGGRILSAQSLTWSSSNGTVASVAATGLVTGVAAGGPVTITATVGGVSGTATVTVTAVLGLSVSVSSAGDSVVMGGTLQLTATVREGNTVLTGRPVTWVSSNPSLAMVSNSGRVTGVYPGGPVMFTATSGGASATAPIRVKAPAQASLVDVYSILDSTRAAFLRYAAHARGDSAQALELTAAWAAAHPRVQSAGLDDRILHLKLNSGLTTAFSYQEVGPDGRSVFRGGGGSGTGDRLTRYGSALRPITNKKVLLCAAAHGEFYQPGEIEKIADRFTNSGLGFEVTLLKNAACDYHAVETFGNYGLVIIDTHGAKGGFQTGALDEPDSTLKTEAAVNAALDAEHGPGTAAKFRSGDLYSYNGHVWVSSQFIRKLPMMPNTIIFGNMCNSGEQFPDELIAPYGPIQPAFVGRGLISYYGYARDDGHANAVHDFFARQMEDSLTQALVSDGDSTGIAHLKSNTTLFFDRIEVEMGGRKVVFPDNRFRQWGAQDFRYWELSITPNPSRAAWGAAHTFEADDKGTGPDRALYEWDFGDGTPKVRVADNPSVQHTYELGPNQYLDQVVVFNVKVTLYNNANPGDPKKFASATGKARVATAVTWQLSEFTLVSEVGSDGGRPGGGFSYWDQNVANYEKISAAPNLAQVVWLPAGTPPVPCVCTTNHFAPTRVSFWLRYTEPGSQSMYSRNSASIYWNHPLATAMNYGAPFLPVDITNQYSQSGTFTAGTMSGRVTMIASNDHELGATNPIREAVLWNEFEATVTSGTVSGTGMTGTVRLKGRWYMPPQIGSVILVGEMTRTYSFKATRVP